MEAVSEVWEQQLAAFSRRRRHLQSFPDLDDDVDDAKVLQTALAAAHECPAQSAQGVGRGHAGDEALPCLSLDALQLGPFLCWHEIIRWEEAAFPT